jgi:hypothetical protein
MGSRGLIPTAPEGKPDLAERAAAVGDREPTLEGDGGLRRKPVSRSFILSVARAHPAAGEQAWLQTIPGPTVAR